MKRTKTSASAWLKGVCRGILMIGLAAVVVPTAAQTAPTKVTYYYTDPQGTVLATADEAGNVTSASDYRPYGTQALGTPEAAPGYTGHVNDPDSGFVYMQARYYDPVKGGFLSVDPVDPSPDNLFSFNRYDYVNNNPITHSDPDGRCSDADGSCGRIVSSYGEHPWATPAQVEAAASLLPIVGDFTNIADAYNDPTALNMSMAVIGLFPEAASVTRVIKGAAGGERAGKAFTRAGKAQVKAENMAAHDGKMVCELCGKEVSPAKQSKKGVSPPGDEAHVDHVVPKSKEGNGSPNNGQVACRDCNLDKGNKHE